MNIDGSDPTNVTAGSLPHRTLAHPNWAPDGTKIVFDDGFDIFTINADGTGLTQLSPAGGAKMLMPSWAPDGNSIVFHRVADAVMRMAPDGTGLTTVASDTNSVWGVAHSPGTEDARIAVVRQITFPGQGVSIIDGNTGGITNIVSSAGAFGVSWAGVPGMSPEARAEEMKASGASCLQIAVEMKDDFSLTANRIAQILKAVGCTAMAIAEALEILYQDLVKAVLIDWIAEALYQAGFDSFTIAGVLKGLLDILSLTWVVIGQRLGLPAPEIAQVLNDVFLEGPAAVWGMFKDLFPAEDIARALKDVFAVSAAQMVALFKGHFPINNIARALKNVYNRTAQQAAQILKGAGFGAQAIASALKNVFDRTAQQTGEILIQLGFGAQAIASSLDKVFSVTIGFLAKILSLKFAATQIAKVLKVVRNAADAAITKALEFAGFKIIAIIRALRDGLGKTAQQAASLLKGAGFTAKQIANGLKNVFDRTVAQTAQILKNVGFAVKPIATALKDVFGRTAIQTASILKNVGFGATAVAQALKDVYGLGKAAVKAALVAAGYAAGAIASAICSVFNC